MREDLTESQKHRIEEIMQEWKKEALELSKKHEESRKGKQRENQLDGPDTWELARLNQRYQQKISEVKKENEQSS